jgi:tetratricopeptide (TPR) repeat protein
MTTRSKACARRGGRIWARLALLTGAVSLTLALPGALHAQAAAQSPDQAAGAHFDRGVELYSEGSLDAALVEFERAYELVPSYKLLYNLAQIQAERHEYTAATSLFERYLADGGAEISATRQAETKAELEKLRERTARLWVESDVEGAELFVNDVLVAKLPLAQAVAINPGVSRIRLEKEGHRPVTRELKVTGGDAPRLTMPLLQFVDDAGPSATAQRADARTQPDYRPVWIASAATVALGGAALTFALMARATDRELDRELSFFQPNAQQLADDRAKLKTFAGLTDGFAVATALGAGVAIYFLVAPPRIPRSSAPSLRDTFAKSLRVVPSGRGLGLHGTF